LVVVNLNSGSMPKRTFIVIAWTAIILLAATLRLPDLAERPMHADEATGARILSDKLETGSYQFDPTHFHGPLLSLTTIPLTKLHDQNSWKELEARTLRLQPALFGMLLVLTPLLFTRWTGWGPSLAAGILLSTSPLLVYYSRMYIHEGTLCLGSVCTLAAFLRWIENPTYRYAIITGLCAGLMAATKETVIICLFAWLVSALLAMRMTQSGKPGKLFWKTLLVGTLCGISVAIILYTDGFKNPRGALDALRTYFIYETTPGHDKPFYYYACLLLCPKLTGGVIWWEGMAAVPALMTITLVSGRYKDKAGPAIRFIIVFLALSAVLHLVVYSLIPYKTPWLMMVPWMHVILLAPFSFLSGAHLNMAKTAGLIMICLLAALSGWIQSKAAISRFSNDARNPYAYVPTTRDVTRLSAWLAGLSEQDEADFSIAVIGTGYWPLPWYLREFEKVGYWANIEHHHVDHPILLVMPALFDEADEAFKLSHTSVPRGLRDNHPMMVFIRNDVWDSWMKESEQ
jgi:uncharacterized protein (TIGR03663 family)